MDNSLPPEPASFAAALLEARRTTLPKRLGEPGPSEQQLHDILAAAGHAPDHDRILPWRFILVPASERHRLGDAFERALRERDSLATSEQLSQAREKAFRGPVLLLAVVRLATDHDVPDAERILSAGCAIQNMLLMSTALGFGSALTSGKALSSSALRELFALAEDEQALCFLSIGTVISTKAPHARPGPEDYVATLSRDRT